MGQVSLLWPQPTTLTPSVLRSHKLTRHETERGYYLRESNPVAHPHEFPSWIWVTMGLMSQEQSRWYQGGKGRLVIKPRELGRLRNREHRARKGEGRKQNNEAGNQGHPLAVWGSGNLFQRLIHPSGCITRAPAARHVFASCIKQQGTEKMMWAEISQVPGCLNLAELDLNSWGGRHPECGVSKNGIQLSSGSLDPPPPPPRLQHHWLDVSSAPLQIHSPLFSASSGSGRLMTWTCSVGSLVSRLQLGLANKRQELSEESETDIHFLWGCWGFFPVGLLQNGRTPQLKVPIPLS